MAWIPLFQVYIISGGLASVKVAMQDSLLKFAPTIATGFI